MKLNLRCLTLFAVIVALPASASAHTLLSEMLLKILLSDVVLAPRRGRSRATRRTFSRLFDPARWLPGSN